jgi:hypothetical protein
MIYHNTKNKYTPGIRKCLTDIISTIVKSEKKEQKTKNPKGSQCSISGNAYENTIYQIVKYCTINGKSFNTQRKEELAGSSSKNDIECDYKATKDIGIEIKKCNTPDWMQCSIKYNINTNKWEGSNNCKIPDACKTIFENLINTKNLYDGQVPPFMERSITHAEWINIKKETDEWDDKYFDIPSDTIATLYKSKGCKYIQISDRYGLYHLGEDICNFNVPYFNIEQQLRIRTKIHSTKNKKGFCSLSVTVAAQPKRMKSLLPSTYSLDNKCTLPLCLIYEQLLSNNDDF